MISIQQCNASLATYLAWRQLRTISWEKDWNDMLWLWRKKETQSVCRNGVDAMQITTKIVEILTFSEINYYYEKLVALPLPLVSRLSSFFYNRSEEWHCLCINLWQTITWQSFNLGFYLTACLCELSNEYDHSFCILVFVSVAQRQDMYAQPRLNQQP